MRWSWFLYLIFLCSFASAQPLDICSGCSYQGRCVSYNFQISSPEGVLYCAEDSRLYPAKPDSDSCSANYECLSFYCVGGVCGSSEPPVVVFDPGSTFLILASVLGSLIFLVVVFLLVCYTRKPSAKSSTLYAARKGKAATKQQPVIPATVKLIPIKKKYSQFESFEKQLEEAGKRIVRK